MNQLISTLKPLCIKVINILSLTMPRLFAVKIWRIGLWSNINICYSIAHMSKFWQSVGDKLKITVRQKMPTAYALMSHVSTHEKVNNQNKGQV